MLSSLLRSSFIDAIEDLLSDRTQKQMKEQFAPLKEENKVSDGESDLYKELATNVLNNLEVVLAQYVVMKVMEYIEKKLAELSMYLLYINRDKISNAIPAKYRKGKVGAMLSKMIGSDTSNDIEKCKLVNSSINQIDRDIAQDKNRMQKTITDNVNTKIKVHDSVKKNELDMFFFLTTTAQWNSNNTQHKELYRSVTCNKTAIFTDKEATFMNEHSDFFKTATGKTYSTAEAIVTNMVANNQIKA